MYYEKSLDDYNQVLFSLAIDKKIDEDRDKKIDEDLNYNFKCLLIEICLGFKKKILYL